MSDAEGEPKFVAEIVREQQGEDYAHLRKRRKAGIALHMRIHGEDPGPEAMADVATVLTTEERRTMIGKHKKQNEHARGKVTERLHEKRDPRPWTRK